MSIFAGIPQDYPLSLQSHNTMYVAKEIIQFQITKTFFFILGQLFLQSSGLIEQISTHKK